jgi:hypothetical protein
MLKTNLKWIEQEWDRWVENESTALGMPIYRMLELNSREHIAKLFAAFCIDRLRIEAEADDHISGGGNA